MEELRSTEALDNEIRNDARKKAERILSKAEESAKALLDGVGKRVDDAKANAENASKARLAFYEKNINASLPLEKERHLVSYIHGAVIDAVNAYFDDLGENRRLEVIEKLVERTKAILEGKTVSAEIIGLDTKAAEKMLKKELGASLASCTVGHEARLADEAVAGFSRREGIILTTDDKQLVCRLTLDEKIKEILDEHSYELASTLFGGRLPE